jgi:cystathionine gamma-synthase
MARRNDFSIDSLLAQADHYTDRATGAVVPPIQTATTFARDGQYDLPGPHVYGRYGTPTTDQTEHVLAKLEGASGALVFASGMAAFAAVVETLPGGARVVAPRIMYHGGQDWLRRMSEKRGIAVDFFDAAAPGALAQEISRDTVKLVWIESPVNPTWDVIDIAEAARLAHAAGAVLGVDSTVAPPVTTRPLELGADVVFHSATKYLNGHSDVTAGVLATKRDDEMWAEISYLRGYMGSILPAFECWLLLRGLRTLSVRFERISANALQIAQHFENDPRLESVLYPGLPSHPGHEVARSQMTRGFGGMLSFMVRGDGTAARKVAAGTELFVPATSLGGVESLIEHRATVEGPHSVVPQNLLRLSVGIEAADDLIADLEQALALI